MAELDPYLQKTTNLERVAGKRLRKQALGRGNRARQYIEKKAPTWKNEVPGGPVAFQSGSNGPHILDKRGR